jgi:membrane protein implicated in regulation of membrane protease activity
VFLPFVGAIATVLLLHLSPLHLIWLAVVCFFAGLPVMLIGPIQEASMGFFVLLAMTGKPSEDEESSKNQETTDQNFQDILEKSAPQNSRKSSKNAKGFGTPNSLLLLRFQ